jgi:hypothetical protein
MSNTTKDGQTMEQTTKAMQFSQEIWTRDHLVTLNNNLEMYV